jgi:hypothetical protein
MVRRWLDLVWMLSQSCEMFLGSLLACGVIGDLLFNSSVMLYIFYAFLVPHSRNIFTYPLQTISSTSVSKLHMSNPFRLPYAVLLKFIRLSVFAATSAGTF